MTTRTRLYALAVIGLMSSQIRAQVTDVPIIVNDPRPVMALVDTLEVLTHIPMNYEDPPFENNPANVHDVTDSVVRDKQRFTGRVLIPKGGELGIIVPASLLSDVRPGNVYAILTAAASAHAAAGYPGRFVILQRGDGWYVEPQAVVGSEGGMKAVKSLMATSISLSYEEKTAAEHLRSIADAIARGAGVRVVIAALPMSEFASRSVALGAENEPAYAVLNRLCSTLASSTRSAAGYSYRLLFDPGLKLYALSLKTVDTAQSAQPAQGPATRSGETRLKGGK